MILLPKTTSLFFAPRDVFVEAQIVELTSATIENQIHVEWWKDKELISNFMPIPIDRYWNWNEMGIESERGFVRDLKVAIVTGDGSVQGAMMISTEPVPSRLAKGEQGLFVELLFTAPRNRPNLRRDGKPYFVGVGSQLLKWATAFSVQGGCRGRLLLDGSPDFLGWYEKRGLQKIGAPPIVFEGVEYTPMELLPEAPRRSPGNEQEHKK